jgi:hypothetical protein
MTPPTFSKQKMPVQKHSWYNNKKRDYATLGTIKLGKGRDEPPVEPRAIDPVAGLKPADVWNSSKEDKAELLRWLSVNNLHDRLPVQKRRNYSNK